VDMDGAVAIVLEVKALDRVQHRAE
jgi:hypothetical protein